MGDHDVWAVAAMQPHSGLLLNGLLPDEGASILGELDAERWAKAEERTAELIKCIQPNKPSEDRRNAVADYVKRLIMQCFPCQVFTFGSVPLKTYLPDGDIDLTAFSNNQNLKDTWAHQVRDMLENEEKNENADFRVKEVQYIQAEVKIIKCLVENIVVDISFQQLGGLCTLCFLEEVDNLINNDHLFKRSIILIKAWCYYESRILGAHHGLISTYALEALVLYIFHVFNSKFAGPLEVLYRFLEFFSKFDWDNFCVSLWGPVPIRLLPDVTAEPPRNDGGEPLLSKVFLEACSTVYASYPLGHENQGQRFMSKYFNVIDPLRVTNNLGRSVSKGNFFRIRSAFAFGAKKLARLLDCHKEEIHSELDQFFINTWERHGSGHRPDAPKTDDHTHMSESLSSSRERNSGCDSHSDITNGSQNVSSKHNSYAFESSFKSSELATVSHAQIQKANPSLNNTRPSDQIRKDHDSSKDMLADKIQRSSKQNNLVGNLQGRYLFSRTQSSPQLTDAYGEDSSRRKHSRVPEAGKGQNRDSAALLGNPTNNYRNKTVLGDMGEDFASPLGTPTMNQEEQDLVSMVASSAGIGFNGQVHVPLNVAAGHMSLPIPSSILASMGYSHRNFPAMVPTNFPLTGAPWGANMQYPQGLISSPLKHYYPGMGLTSNSEDLVEDGNENFRSVAMTHGDAENDFWNEQERGASGDIDIDNGNFGIHHHSEDKHQSTSDGYNSVPSSLTATAGGSSRVTQKFMKERQGSVGEDHADIFPYHESSHAKIYFDDRLASPRSFSTAHSGSVKSKTSSESSWEGYSTVPKSSREKRGRKMASAVYGKGKSVSEHSSKQEDDGDDKDWNPPLTTATEMTDRMGGHQPSASSPASRCQLDVIETTLASGSESLLPIGPVILGPGSQQRTTDNAGVVPLTFYPTGPPVPFVTMLPLFNFPSETGNPDASSSQFSGEDAVDNSGSGKNFEAAEGHNQVELLTSSSTTSASSVKPLEHKSDILNSDFVSHWHNLQYGRFCQNSRNPAPLIYSSPIMVPPIQLQGHYPWDGPGRVLSNMDTFTQVMSYGPRVVPVAPIQPVSGRPAGVYQQYMDEMPRYRSGTGTYLPNPKVAARDRHSMNTRRGNYTYDRSDHHSNREGNWNPNVKSKGTGRSHSRGQSEKSSSRPERFTAGENRGDRSWVSHRHDPLPSYQSQNGPIHSNSAQSSSGNVAFGMYPLQTVNPDAVSPNGSTIPSVVMFYPYDHYSAGYDAAEKLEFGSIGPMNFSGMNGPLRFDDGNQMSGGGFDDQNFHGTTAQRSSPDQPSSPHIQR